MDEPEKSFAEGIPGRTRLEQGIAAVGLVLFFGAGLVGAITNWTIRERADGFKETVIENPLYAQYSATLLPIINYSLLGVALCGAVFLIVRFIRFR